MLGCPLAICKMLCVECVEEQKRWDGTSKTTFEMCPPSLVKMIRTLLMHASYRGRLDLVEVLFAAGADCTIADINNDTALSLCCEGKGVMQAHCQACARREKQERPTWMTLKAPDVSEMVDRFMDEFQQKRK